jgi:hypothetical protein
VKQVFKSIAADKFYVIREGSDRLDYQQEAKTRSSAR